MSDTKFIVEFVGTNGAPIGVQLGGYTVIPFAQGGIIMQDSAGTYHLLTMGTDGRLSSVTVTL